MSPHSLVHAAYLIPLLPLAGFAVLLAFGRRLGNPLAGWLATAAVGASFVATVVTFVGLASLGSHHRAFTQVLFAWIPVGGLRINAAFLVDPLSMTMALFVTGVSTLIHLYSIGYMEHDEKFPSFFVYLNLFVFSMLVLVLADNFVLSFLGWEGVGACSYWLIAFWFDRDSAASAGKKAFVFNRIGDFGFLIAMFLIFTATHTLTYSGVFAAIGHLSGTTLTAIALLLFLGAVGKSAQIPLFPWLLDAMEGPTPVSALIHAATMVTAGVYLMARISPILSLSSSALLVVACVGAATAFLAATAACAQTDIKRVLAYSTVSQLGYMFLAIGARAYVAAIFLMVTHAFYKALLFLGAGSVMHGLHDEQDLRRMGNLRKLMPVTALTFIVGWLAIAGVPPFAGFWSKSDVLLNAYALSPGLWAVGAVTAALTAYYMGRETVLAFYGPDRWRGVAGGARATVPSAHAAAAGAASASASPNEPHDPRWVMRAPLVVLAALSFLGGLINLPFHPTLPFLSHWLDPVFGSSLRVGSQSATFKVGLGILDAVLAVVGVGLALRVWLPQWNRPRLEPRFLLRGWRIDDLYDALIARPGTALAAFSAYVFDRRVIDGAVNGTATLVRSGADRLRQVQTGFVRNYALGVAAGVVGLLAWVVTRSTS